MESLTDEQQAARIAALTEELRGYETHGDTDRTKQVKAELKALGAEGKTPQKRAAARGKKKATEL